MTPESFKQKVSPSKDATALVCNAKGCQPGKHQASSDRHIGTQENSTLRINSPAPPVSSQPLFLGYCAIAWNACSTAKGIVALPFQEVERMLQIQVLYLVDLLD